MSTLSKILDSLSYKPFLTRIINNITVVYIAPFHLLLKKVKWLKFGIQLSKNREYDFLKNSHCQRFDLDNEFRSVL